MIGWSAGPSRTSRPRTWRSAIVNSKGWSNQVSMVSLTSLNSQFAERPEQDRFLRMDAVLGFVPDARLRAVDHRIDDLVAAEIGERRVGKEGVSTCRSRGSPYHSKQKRST